jgi:hypothetical protein
MTELQRRGVAKVYAANYAVLQDMVHQAERTGAKVGGYTAAQLRTFAVYYLKRAQTFAALD